MSSIAQGETTYKRLRSEYDRAFQHLALELQNLTQPEAQSNVEISAAHRSYLRRRNDLADYLLSRRAEAPLTPAALPNERKLCSIEEHAYFRRKKSGRPGGNDQANWYDAEAHFS